MKARAMLAIALIVGSLLAVLIAGLGERSDATRSALTGSVAPEFSLPTLGGEETVRSSDLAGKTVVLNFWNSWCVPCKEELPALRTFFDRHRANENFVMIGVLRDDTVEAALEERDRAGIEWTLVDDPRGTASIDFGVRGQPETYVIAPDGTVAATQIGPASVGDLEQMLEAAGL